jgi:hypothetical protein
MTSDSVMAVVPRKNKESLKNSMQKVENIDLGVKRPKSLPKAGI